MSTETTSKTNTYSVSLAMSVRVYGTATVEAASLEEAAEKLRASAEEQSGAWEVVSDTDWSTSNEYSILSISQDKGGQQVDGIDLCTGVDYNSPLLTREELAEEIALQLGTS